MLSIPVNIREKIGNCGEVFDREGRVERNNAIRLEHVEGQHRRPAHHEQRHHNDQHRYHLGGTRVVCGEEWGCQCGVWCEVGVTSVVCGEEWGLSWFWEWRRVGGG